MIKNRTLSFMTALLVVLSSNAVFISYAEEPSQKASTSGETATVIPDGVVTVYHNNGKKKTDSTYREGKKNGLEIGYSSYNGRKEMASTYVNDVKDGLEVKFNIYNDKNEKTSEVNYKNGLKEGVERTYYSGYRTEVNYINGLKEGPLLAYACPGKEPVILVRYVHDKKDGVETDYSCGSGTEQGITNYIHGVKEGAFYKKSMEKNKQGKYEHLTTKGHYKNNQYEGEVTKTNHTTGSMVTTHYNNGLKDGIEIHWEKNKARTETVYRKNRATDDIKHYYPSGKLRSEAVFNSEGRRTAVVTWYENGQKKEETPYAGSSIHGSVIGWHSNGKVAYERPFIHNYQHGLSRSWYADGTRASEKPYFYNKLMGIVKNYSPSGKLTSQVDYIQGEYNDADARYYNNGELTLDNYEEINQSLERTYKSLLYALPGNTQKVLQKSQALWVEFADAHCTSRLSLNNEPMMNCRADEAIARIQRLKDMKETFTYKGLNSVQLRLASIFRQFPSPPYIFDNHDLWPAGGQHLEGIYELLISKITPEAIEILANTPIYLTGPHVNNWFDDNNAREFGHYNPIFLQWLQNNISALLANKKFIQESRAAVNENFMIHAETYLLLYYYLEKNPDFKKVQLNSYRNYLKSDEYNYNIGAASADQYSWIEKQVVKTLQQKYTVDRYFEYRYARTMHFWMRRMVDDTSEQFASLLSIVINAYNPALYAEIMANNYIISGNNP